MKIIKYETNYKRKLFLEKSNCNKLVKNEFEENQIINIYPYIEFQSFLGFGGALTESSCYNLSKIDNTLCNKILDDYFSKYALY